jgi:hypothetical protein
VETHDGYVVKEEEDVADEAAARATTEEVRIVFTVEYDDEYDDEADDEEE